MDFSYPFFMQCPKFVVLLVEMGLNSSATRETRFVFVVDVIFVILAFLFEVTLENKVNIVILKLKITIKT